MQRLGILFFVFLSGGVILAQEEPFATTMTPAFSPVTWERLVNSDDEPENWLMYSGSLSSQRHSTLDEINNRNVSDLEFKWSYQIPVIDRAETVPLVVDGIMFITEAPSNVVAVDAVTGRQYWRYDHELPEDLRICCGRNNRGVAILGETLFMSTLDAHLVAIDARTGNLLWDVEVADYESGYSKTAAPLIVKDTVVTGIAGGEFGIRGFVDGYDAETGERRWRTYTIAGPGNPDVASWADDSWETGGGASWITGSYDADLNLIYWGTGNPGPDWNGDARLGDNLYSDSALALNGDTGELEWYFQFTPHDVHDWDAIQVPILADIEYEGATRQVIMWANRNAFYYTLDRATGEFLVGEPYATQTWALGLDANGRPMRAPNTIPTYEGVVVSPSVGGGTNWWSAAYSPRSELFYVNAFDGEQRFFKRDEEYERGERFTGGGGSYTRPMDTYYSALRAIDPATGDIAWEFPVQPRTSAGISTTAGDLVLSGSVDGYFYALDANTGEELWHISLGRRVHAAPMTFAVAGKQYITVAAGNVVYTFALRD
ncbi:MAG: PQQ-dependent dehydrogenase, methanol/ethanol family [Gammaproteobacteria bacterium]|jgi:alcohol dehydrogenase (cytochrome c)|nr:PQQ-dependent dehydrogenase, methanol/ethanol family [Gammaproteobacteria bacterium]MDP6096394.1 PQQ-dependent dehydrogenase, methanol/ethanol family [Gammaproteobacteria bacterium]MDP7455150.1 PQQ-dependent dehydrogenase, methanol/ethanol family [Gammaproteobacteria bacterium]|tara:strand:+ start:994 stop:2628 length:1635 start_codon:yes stop_codon:yes gene_type:complete